jgi:hypothetical protein
MQSVIDRRVITHAVFAGSDFGLLSQTTVDVGGNDCAITLISESSITCTLGPLDQATTLVIGHGDVVVTTGGQDSNAVALPIAPPCLATATPSNGDTAGDYDLHIHGSSFGHEDMPATVFIGSKACDVTAQTHTDITCTVPANTGVYSVKVQRADSEMFVSLFFKNNNYVFIHIFCNLI